MTAEEIKQIAAAAGKYALETGPKHDATARAIAIGRGGEPGLFLAEGLWLNKQAMEYGAEMLSLYVCPELIYSDEWAQVTAALVAYSAETFILSPRILERLSDDKSDRGILSVIRLPHWTLEDIPAKPVSTILVLDGLENPGNVGTLIRTADGAGADAVILCNRRTGLNNRATIRSSLCTLLGMPVVEAETAECMAFLNSRGYTIYLGKAESSERYCDIRFADRSAVVVGHEKYGVSAPWFEHAHIGVSIPMLGRVDSLNVAVAGGILLYEVGRSRPSPHTPPPCAWEGYIDHY